jgi:protein-S-isoprenylcysteine O-methyltransferase Ste14
VTALHFALRGWISAAIFAWVAAARFFSDSELRPGWLLLVALGAAYRVHAARYIRDHSNGSRMAEGPLATEGPYALGRHPLYLSNLAVAAGIILFAGCFPWWDSLLALSITFVHYDALARAEERFLLPRLGEAYASYLRSTPRWLGWPRRRLASDAAAPLPAALGRQAGNLGKAAACVGLLWALASRG